MEKQDFKRRVKMNTVKIDYELKYSAENIVELMASLSGTIGLTRKEQTNALQIILLNLVFYSFCPLVTQRAIISIIYILKQSHATRLQHLWVASNTTGYYLLSAFVIDPLLFSLHL